MEVEGVVADTPGYRALLASCRSLVGLAFNAQVHDVVAANGTVVDDDIPGPESNGIPLFDLEAFLVSLSTGTGLGCLGFGWGRICHVNVRHD